MHHEEPVEARDTVEEPVDVVEEPREEAVDEVEIPHEGIRINLDAKPLDELINLDNLNFGLDSIKIFPD